MSDDEFQPSQNLPPRATDSLEEALQVMQTAQREDLERQISAAGGPGTWLSSQCPRVAAKLDTITTERPASSAELLELLLRETAAFWQGIEVRLKECGRCPPEGAACEDTRHRIHAGRLVSLEIHSGKPSDPQVPCERYQEFRMGKRLESIGVDKRLSRVRLPLLAPEPTPELLAAFDAFIDAGTGERAPVGISLLIEGQKAREYGVTLLRSTMKKYRSCSCYSVHVESLIRAWKDAMTSKLPSPVLGLISPDVLVLDGIDNAFLSSEKHGLKEIRWLYNRRRDLGLATIITALCPAKEVFPNASVLRV